ncbi:S41 family peptidase [Wukongibacter baidiensis]|uniref:S41 family peptidase n=1 Tax=Wukongibacter baidiensis TaxID=1723361 RepID=UPI003D7FF534
MKKSDLFKRTSIYALAILTIWMALCIPSLAQSNTIEEVASLLEYLYVDEVSERVLEADTIEEMIELLDDPYTMHFTAEEYEEFINSMEMTFTGIGIYLEIVPEGVLILSTIEGSPAKEAGFKSGDIIIEADGISMENTSSEEAVVIIGGTEGTSVELVVKREDEVIKKSVIRKKIEIPTVSGEVLDGHIGYIDLNSFAKDTGVEFGEVVDELLEDEDVDSWIIDLRDNPGGYLDASLDIAGYFIGENLVLQMKNKEESDYGGYAMDHDYTIDDPVIFLVNDYSASASEILAAAMKDYEKGALIGKNTYGKGSVQAMYDLSDGSVLKMTVYRFYSPEGNGINEVGVAPDLDISEDSLLVAELLLGDSGSEEDKSGYMQIQIGPNTFEIDMDKAREDEYWEAFNDILREADSDMEIKRGSETGWEDVTEDEIENSYRLLYPEYRVSDKLSDVSASKEFTIRFSDEVDMDTVTEESIELIDIENSERVPLDFKAKGNGKIRAIPDESLENGKSYWLIVHDSVRGENGSRLNQGVLCEVLVEK